VPIYESGAIKYYRFASLEDHGIYHALFTRHGGFSPTPWHSLNFGASVGDDLHRVIQNRETALKSLHIRPNSVFDVYQVHSTIIVKTNKPLDPNEAHFKADAIITNQPGVTLMMRFADCVPILLFDPVNRAIAIIHAGWIGTVDKIARKSVLEMVANYGTNPKDIIAAIGPSIGPDHYSVGKDVIDRVKASFGEKAKQVIVYHQNKSIFDLWKANQIVLADVGVRNIEISEICTCCNLGDWYSHRGEFGTTGRFGVIFGLRQ
jgi:hypothetical protein